MPSRHKLPKKQIGIKKKNMNGVVLTNAITDSCEKTTTKKQNEELRTIKDITVFFFKNYVLQTSKKLHDSLCL